jgi:hypothetical protein
LGLQDGETLKKGWKIVLSVVSGLLLLSLLAIGFTQTRTFRDWLRGYILTAVRQNTNGELYLGDFSGSLFTGLTIRGASLSLNGEEVFSADVVELRYDPLALPRRHISLGRLVLTHPKFHPVRSSQGVWNFQRLPKEGASPSSPVSFLEWALELKSLEIIDGEVSLEDSTALGVQDSAGSAPSPYREVVLRNVNSKMSASVSIDEVRLSVDHLSLKAPSFATQLVDFTGKLQYSKEKISLNDVRFRTTGTELTLAAEADSLDFLKGLEATAAEDHRVHFDLDVSRISFAELQRFFPRFPLQSGNARLNLSLNGTIANLQLEKFDLKTDSSEVKLSGRIQNILHPKDCNVDLAISGPSVDPREVAACFSSLEVPDISRLEKASLTGHFKGKLDNFEIRTAVDFKEAGKLEATAQLDLRGTDPQYQARFATRDFDLGSLMNDEQFESRLNISGEVTGKGVNVESADFTGTATVDSSEIANIPLEDSKVSINARNRIFQGEASFHSHQSSLQAQYSLDLSDETTPALEAKGDFSSIDLSQFLRDDNYRSNVTGNVAVTSSGKDLDHASGTLVLDFQESSFRDRSFGGPGVKLTLDQRKQSKKKIVVESPIVDANISGDFHLAPFLSLVKFEVGNVLYSLKQKLPFVDSARAIARETKTLLQTAPPRLPATAAQENLNFNYVVDVKDLTPLAVYFGEEDFNAKGSVRGSVVGNADDLFLSIDAAIENVVLRGKETKLLIAKGKAYVEVDHLKQADVLDALENRIKLEASTFILNSLRANNLMASVDYFHGKGSFDASALLDSALTIETNGSVGVTEDGYIGNFDNLTLSYHGYAWTNRTPILATIDTSGLMLKNVEMAHLASRLSLSGGITPNGDFAVGLKLKSFDISDLSYFLSPGRKNSGDRRFGGQASAEVTLAGNFADPVFTYRVASTDLKYGTVAFGTLQIDGEYREHRTRVNLEFRSSSPIQSEKPDLLVSGSLPVNLAFEQVDDRFPDEPVDLTIEATGFHLDILDPFIPVFDDIHGQLFADVRLGGTMKKVSSSGTMRLEDGRFVFTPNGITYYVAGTFEPNGEKIQISKLTIRNGPKDEPAKGLTVAGEVTIQNLFIGSFDLTAQGQLLILKETARKGHTAPYGNLLIGIGEDGLRYHGTIDESYLTGSVNIKTMAISFPPVSLQASTKPTSTFLYTVIDDTSKPLVHREAEDSLSEEFFQSNGNGEPEESAQRSQKSTFDKLIAGMMVDLSIETEGPSQLTMFIDYSTGEELFSELHGRLLLTKDEFGTRFTGDVDVGQRSYYYFYKRFDATGKLKFTGALDNPEMDITAQYEGYRTPSHADSLEAMTLSTSKEQRVVVTLKITGTRKSPKLAIGMTVDDKDGHPVEWQGDVQSDAITFIISGKFRDDLTASDRSQIAADLGTSVTSTVITGVTSSIFSGVLTDFLRSEFGGFIRQAEVTYSGGNVSESADLRLTGEVGETVIRVGGRVFNDIGNANVNIQMPVGRIIGAPALEDLIIELERKVEGSNYATDERKLTNGARVYYRITF